MVIMLLRNSSEIYSDRILKEISDYCEGADVISTHITESTNTDAKSNFSKNGCKNTIYLTDSQTHGRGRQGHTFYSPTGGIFFSIVFNGELSQIPVTVITCSSIVKILESHGFEPSIKWVNDIYVNGRKVCGILCERIIGEKTATVIGVGINYSVDTFPKDISQKAASLFKDLNGIEEFSKELIVSVYQNITRGDVNQLKEYYKSHMGTIGKNISFKTGNELITGKVTGIGQNEELLIEDLNGNTRRFLSGEIIDLTD